MYSVFLTYLHLERTTELWGSGIRKTIVWAEQQVFRNFSVDFWVKKIYPVYMNIKKYTHTQTHISHDEQATILFVPADYIVDIIKHMGEKVVHASK